ncbi:FAD:protein FMN transferase [Actinomadura verrucosospora]|uniref:FAD:protein FMN transferase n=1 Tax=Actinomadura verrucosospora TaxID=46165 RepID=UPI0031EB1BFA
MSFGRDDFPLWGSLATVMVEKPECLDAARRAVDSVVADFDAAFVQEGSDLARVNAASGAPVRVSATFLAVLWTALHAFDLTEGLVDPVVGDSPAGNRSVVIDEPPGTVMTPPGTTLDLWGIAQAFAADRAAESAAGLAGCGVCVCLPGSFATAGPVPVSGWPVQVTNGRREQDDGAFRGMSLVLRTPGGLATSVLAAQAREPGQAPARSLPASDQSWHAVSVFGLRCVAAKTASIAALSLGDAAITWLEARELRARIVHTNGTVTNVGC